METAVEKFVAINFIIIGLSHLLQPGAWMQFFRLLHGKGEAGVFFNGFLTLTMGSIIVATHNVWVGVPTLLTVIGWAYVLKSAVIFSVPRLGLRSMAKGISGNPKKYVVAGVGMILIGAVIGYGAVV